MKSFLRRFELFFVFLLCLLTASLLSIGINRPFIGHHDDNDWYYSEVGKNYLRYGILNLKFGQLIPNQTPQSREFYTHHPPLLPLSLAGSLSLFGSNFWSVRLVPITFSVVTLVVFYLLLRQFYPIIPSLFSLAFWIVTPMFLYFGKMADHEAPTLFFIVLSLCFYIKWTKSRQKRDFYLLLGGLFLGEWSGWPTYYLAGVLVLLSRRLEILAMSVVNFSFFLLDNYLLTGSAIGGGLGEILLFRMGIINSLSWVTESYTTVQLVSQEGRWLYHFFTPTQFIVVVIALVASVYSWIKEKLLPKQGVIWLIFLFIATLHVILFRTGAWRHDYWLYYFLPFFAWGIAQSLWLLKHPVFYGIFLILLVISVYQGQPFFWALQNIIAK